MMKNCNYEIEHDKSFSHTGMYIQRDSLPTGQTDDH
jgi:hypothetical protein